MSEADFSQVANDSHQAEKEEKIVMVKSRRRTDLKMPEVRPRLKNWDKFLIHFSCGLVIGRKGGMRIGEKWVELEYQKRG